MSKLVKGESITSTTPASPTTVKATGVATKLDKSLAGAYTVTASSGLNVRNAAGTAAKVLVTIPKGIKVKNYGYYTPVGSVKWLFVQFTYKGVKVISMDGKRVYKPPKKKMKTRTKFVIVLVLT